MDDGDGNPFSNHVVILLIAMGSAAFVVSMYHVIAICWCNQRMAHPNTPPQQPPPTENTPSVADMIPTHTYHKKKVDRAMVPGGGDDDGGICAVCLGDYEEGEELKTMPECMHSFHVPCIDMWLSLHTSCPVCRSSATPSLEVLHSDHDHFDYAYQHSIDMTQFVNGYVLRR